MRRLGLLLGIAIAACGGGSRRPPGMAPPEYEEPAGVDAGAGAGAGAVTSCRSLARLTERTVVLAWLKD